VLEADVSRGCRVLLLPLRGWTDNLLSIVPCSSRRMDHNYFCACAHTTYPYLTPSLAPGRLFMCLLCGMQNARRMESVGGAIIVGWLWIRKNLRRLCTLARGQGEIGSAHIYLNRIPSTNPAIELSPPTALR
jgi:hypothetical protein